MSTGLSLRNKLLRLLGLRLPTITTSRLLIFLKIFLIAIKYFFLIAFKAKISYRGNVRFSMPEWANHKYDQYQGFIPLRSKKAGRFAKLLGFARSHSIVTRGSVSLSCASTPPLPDFLNLNGIKICSSISFLRCPYGYHPV